MVLVNLLRNGWICVDGIIGSISSAKNSTCLLMMQVMCDYFSKLAKSSKVSYEARYHNTIQ